MPKDFFESFNDVIKNYDPMKEVVPLAMKKFELDMEQQKFNLIKQNQETDLKTKLDSVAADNRFTEFSKQYIKDKQEKGEQPNPMDLFQLGITSGAIHGADVYKSLEQMTKPISVGSGGLMDPITKQQIATGAGSKPLSDIGKLQYDKDALLKSGARPDDPQVKAIDDEMKKKAGENALGGNTDFETFKAGRPQKEGESSADWNKRVSDEWESKQDKRAINKAGIIGNIKIDLTEKQRQRVLSAGASDLVKAAGGQDKLDIMYEQYARYGKVPAMGLGQGLRWAFLGGASQWAKDHGMDARSMEISSMQTKGAKTAYDNLAKVKSVSGVAGETAIKHGETALEIMDKKDRTGSPVIDRWFRAGRKAVVGDADVTAFDTNVHILNRELSRYLTSMTAGGQMNQKESDEINGLIASSHNPAQFKKNYDTVVKLIKEKEQTFNEQLNEIKMSIPGQEDNFIAGGKATKTITLKSGKTITVQE